MARWTIFIIACLIASLAPFWATDKSATTQTANNPRRLSVDFPAEFEGAQLTELPLTKREQFFVKDFPGKFGRFTDGRREIIFRFVTEATRQLHPASDCFAAIGYKTKPLPLRIDLEENRWSCFAATKNNENLRACERIYSLDKSESFTDVSAWYWSAMSKSNGEWLAVTTAETLSHQYSLCQVNFSGCEFTLERAAAPSEAWQTKFELKTPDDNFSSYVFECGLVMS